MELMAMSEREVERLERLLNRQELARLLGVSVSWVRDRTNEGVIPHLRLSERVVRYRASEVRRWMDERRG
jgi:excisionase family DNA binding protein